MHAARRLGRKWERAWTDADKYFSTDGDGRPDRGCAVCWERKGANAPEPPRLLSSEVLLVRCSPQVQLNQK